MTNTNQTTILTALVGAAMTYAEKAAEHDTALDRRDDSEGINAYDHACAEAEYETALDALHDAEYDLKEAARLCTVEAVHTELASKEEARDA